MSDSRDDVAGDHGIRLSPNATPSIVRLTLEQVQRMFAPRYAVEGQIGAGGSAIVYLAHDREKDRRVAIKVLRPELAANVVTARFLREVDLGHRLEHQNVLQVLESGIVEGLLYFTMPFVDGETLRQRLAREGNLSIEDALAIARAVANAIDHAHERDIIHRDIKPANILLGGDGSVVVADFGIARAMTESATRDLTETGVVIGTAAYMSPEQGSGSSRIDTRTDVYSLGCLVYEMLGGEPPFTGPTTQVVIARAFHEEPRGLNVVRPAVTIEMDRVIGKALAKVASDRFATAGAFVDALEVAATQTTTSRDQQNGAQRTRRRPLLLAIAASVLLLALVGGSVWVAKLRNASTVPSRLFLAIRPFKGPADSTSFGWLGASLETQLANALFEAPDLSLRSASALAPYASHNIADDSLARLVGVDFFLDGQIIHSGDSVGVTVQLVDPKAATVLAVETVRASVQMSSERLLDSAALRIKAALLPVIGQTVRSRMWAREGRDSVAVALRYRAHELRWAGEAIGDNEPRTAAARFREADSLLIASAARAPRWKEPRVARAALAARRAAVERNISGVSGVRAILAEGIAAVESVLREDSTAVEALAYRGRLRWRMYLWGIDGVDAPLLDSAETDLRRAAAATPPIAFALQDLSEIVWMERRRFAEARELAMRAYKLDAYQDETGLLINRIAIASLNVGDDVDALNWCRIGLRRFPHQPQHLACVLEVMAWGNQPASPDSARAIYRQLVARHATDGVRWHFLLRVAGVHARAGEKSEAEKLVAQVRREMGDAKADPTYYLPWEAGVFFRLGNTGEGERLFEQFRIKVPVDVPLWTNGIPLRGYVAPVAQR